MLPTRKNAFEMVGRMLGVESESVQALGVALSLLRDPQTRAALDQINRARLQATRHDVPTRILDEDTYPVGGFSSISTRGRLSYSFTPNAMLS